MKPVTVAIVSPSICMNWWDWMPWSSFFECWVLSQLFHFHQEALQFLFIFCRKGGVICISEVIDISPDNLDSSLCFIQLSISTYSLGFKNDTYLWKLGYAQSAGCCFHWNWPPGTQKSERNVFYFVEGRILTPSLAWQLDGCSSQPSLDNCIINCM